MHSPRLNFEAHPGASTRLGPFRSFISALLAGLLALSGLAAVAAPASAEDGIILAGTLTPPDGYELSDLDQFNLWAVSDADGEELDSALLELETGKFSFSELPSTDSYKIQVEAWGSNYGLSGWVGADGTVGDIADAAVFDSSRSDISVSLEFRVTISGTVTISGDAALDLSELQVWATFESGFTDDDSWGFVGVDGSFSLRGLSPEYDYRLHVSGPRSTYVFGYVGADNKAGVNWDNAALFTAGTSDINITLERGITLSGTLIAPSGADMSEVHLVAYSATDGAWIDSVSPDLDNGGFQFGALPSTDSYNIAVEKSGSADILTGWLGQDGTVVRDIEDAAVFSSSRSDIDIVTVLGETLSGTIASGDGAEIDFSAISISAYSVSSYSWVDVDESGNFQFRGLWPDEQIRLEVHTYDFVEGTYDYVEGYVGADYKAGVNWDSAALFTADAGDINITLERGIALSGTLIAPSGADMSEVLLAAYSATDGAWIGSVWPDPDNWGFQLGALPSTDSYNIAVEKSGSADILTGWLGQDGTMVRDIEDAAVFSSSRSDIDIVTVLGETLSGTIASGDGAEIDFSAIGISAYSVSSYSWVDVDESGNFQLRGLWPDEQIRLEVNTYDAARDYVGGYVGADNKAGVNWDSAALFTADAGDINITLERGITLSGTVTVPDGNPVNDFQLYVSELESEDYTEPRWVWVEEDGTFSSPGLPAGKQYVLRARVYSDDSELGEYLQTGYLGLDGKLVKDLEDAKLFTETDHDVQISLDFGQSPTDTVDPPKPPTKPVTPVKPKPVEGPKYTYVQVVPSPDLTGDGFGDLLAVDTSGVLWLFRGSATGNLNTPTKLGGGWAGLTISAPGDFNGDGKADILAKATNGDLFFYPGNGKGGLGAPTKAGWGWGPYEIIPAGDVTGDGIADVLAIDAKGVLYYYAGDGNGKFKGKLTQNGQGWTNVDLYPAGDLNGDGNADILSIRKDGTLHTHLGRGDGGFRKSTQSGKGWAGYELFAGSDGNGDGLADLYSRNTKGELFFYAGKTGGFRTAVKVGTNW